MGKRYPYEDHSTSMVRKRSDFSQYFKDNGLRRHVSAEIGVAEGYFSWDFLDHWPGIHYLIDPWRKQDVPGYSVHGDEDQQGRFERVLEKAKTYGGRAIVIRATSAEASTFFRDYHFDFVYIDANHQLEAIRDDLALWWPKVKHQGIFAGHDYLQGMVGGVDYGVKTAVDEFVQEKRLSLRTTLETDYPSWWIEKS